MFAVVLAFGPGERKGRDIPLKQNSLTQSVLNVQDTVPLTEPDPDLLEMTNDSIGKIMYQKRKEEKRKEIEELINY
jgi:hypothetical protein